MVLPASTWAKAIGSQTHSAVSTPPTAFDSIPAEGHLLQDILPGHKLLTPLREYGIVDTADIAYEFGLAAEHMDRQGNPSAAVARAARLMPPTSSVELARFLLEVQRRLSVDKSLPPPSSMHSLSYHTQTLLKGILPSSTASPRKELKPLPPPPLPFAESPELQTTATPLVSRASTPSERSRNDTSLTAPSSPTEQSEVAVGLEPVLPLPPLPPAAPMLSGLKALDDCFADDLGVPPGCALEILGPTASGKTRLGLQLAVDNRLAGLLMGRQTKAGGEPLRDEQDGQEQEGTQGRRGFDEVLVIDTEGSLTPDIIGETVWRRVQLLKLGSLEGSALFEEVLDGMHLVRPASLPELIATLRVLISPPAPPRPARQQPQPEAEAEVEAMAERTGPLPPLRSLGAIFLDTFSFHLRTPIETTPERRARRHALSLLSSLLPLLAAQNPHVRVVATGQMSLKMFSRAGELVTYRTPGSIARMVPQVDPPGGTVGGAGGEYAARGWAGEAGPGGGAVGGGGGAAGQEKGPGVFGEGAWRVLLFRLGQRRMAQLFYSPPPPHTKHEEDEGEDEGPEGAHPTPHPHPHPHSAVERGSQVKRRKIRARRDEGRWIPFGIDAQGHVVEE